MKKILLILVSLIIFLAVLLTIWNRTKEATEGLTLRIENKERVISFSSLNKIEKMSFQTKRGDEYSGYQLLPLLQKSGVSDYKYLILFSEDGGSLRLNKDDIANAYLIWLDDIEKPNLRLIITTDEFGQRWMKYLIAIEIK